MDAKREGVLNYCQPFPWVRSAQVAETFVLFDPRIGRYFTLTEEAADFWSNMVHVQPNVDCHELNEDLCAEFFRRKLIDCSMDIPLTVGNPETATAGIHEHSMFDSLILNFPEIDSPLMNEPLYVDLPESNQRKLLEQFQIRRFTESLIQESIDYSRDNETVAFDIQLGPALIRVKVPESDRHLKISLTNGFPQLKTSLDKSPDFSISIFDDTHRPRKTQLDFPPDWHFPLGEVDGERAPKFRVAIDRHTQSVSAFSINEGKCATWMPKYDELPYWSAATPLRLQLSWIADTLGLEFLHAAAIVHNGKAILFAGPSGSGKSTLALKLAQLGFPLVSDDFLLASETHVQAVYRRLKVHDWSALRVLPEHWRVLNASENGQKRIVDPGEDLITEPIPVSAIVVPEIGKVPELSRISQGQAFSAIAPASLSGLLGGSISSLQRISNLVSRYPCFHFKVSEGVLEDSKTLIDSLNRISMNNENW